jgi:aminoglycoside phosphotransferase (APT) family kinase protein
LAELHQATPVVVDTASSADLVLPGRDRLHEVLRDLAREWTGGPYAEPARKLLAVHARHVERLLADFDRRVDRVRDTAADWVVAHGEPHPGNVMCPLAGLSLIDWGTVQIGPPLRDLWMLTAAFASMLGEEPVGDVDDVLARYARATGRTVTSAGLALYRVWWKVADSPSSLRSCAGRTAPVRTSPRR